MNEVINRAGVKSSEFYAFLVFVAMVLLNGTQYVSIPVEQITMVAGLAFGYGGGRNMLKNTMAKAFKKDVVS